MSTPQTAKYSVDLWIGNCPRNWNLCVRKFEWKSMLNGGHIIRAKIVDHGFDLLDAIFKDGQTGRSFFRTARYAQQPTLVFFRIKWTEGYETPIRTALISDMDARGQAGYGGVFEFIAVDPISFYLNSGDASGKCYRGVVGGDDGVIMQVLDKYLPDSIGGMDVVKHVSKTNEVEANHWMMRQDPKTFIASLLDWSSSLTDHRTHWIVSNGEDDLNLSINIEESYTPSLRDVSQCIPADQPNRLIFKFGGNKAQEKADDLSWEMIHDSFIVALNTKLVTGGISAISGEYLDRITEAESEDGSPGSGRVFVEDNNTENKANPTFGEDRGYSKPDDHSQRGWTQIGAIPEFNAGDIGLKYGNYIDGRARQIYMGMLNMVMRIRLTVNGEPRLFDSTDLGRTQVTLKWLGVEDSEAKFMDGNWLLYGWQHKLHTTWKTDVYLARLDYDAAAIPGQGGA